MKILLTGATGFLGSHIAEYFVQQHQLILTCRESSNFDKCTSFYHKANWVNTDAENWEQEIIDFKPDVIIHAAWNGVENEKRNDWNIQLSNIDFTYKILKIAQKSTCNKFIGLGSQAEYGQFDCEVTEEYNVNPIGSYGSVKLSVLELIKSFCLENQIQWYWLRVFSVIGKNDNANWLIPQAIRNLRANKAMELTEGKQAYDYLYILDFLEKLNRVAKIDVNNSGVYNLCSGRPIQIKELLQLIADKLNKNRNLLQFGALAYRENQTMLMVGSTEKYDAIFGESELTSIEESILNIL